MVDQALKQDPLLQKSQTKSEILICGGRDPTCHMSEITLW